MWDIYRMKMVIGSEYYYTYIDESTSGSTFNIPGWLGKRNGQSQIGYISTSLWKHSREAFSWFIGTNMSYKCYQKKIIFFFRNKKLHYLVVFLCFVFQGYSKIWSISLGHFMKHNPLWRCFYEQFLSRLQT